VALAYSRQDLVVASSARTSSEVRLKVSAWALAATCATFLRAGDRQHERVLDQPTEGNLGGALVVAGADLTEQGHHRREPLHRKQYEVGVVTPPGYRITCIYVDKRHRRSGLAGSRCAVRSS
jgi:hypothetical protein